MFMIKLSIDKSQLSKYYAIDSIITKNYKI